MKDPVLNRPLFRKKALHQQQIQTGNVPKYVLGGLIPLATTAARFAAPYVARVIPAVGRTKIGRSAIRSAARKEAKEAAFIAKKAGVKKLVLTHFSRRYKSVSELEKEAKKIFRNSVASKDFMKITL